MNVRRWLFAVGLVVVTGAQGQAQTNVEVLKRMSLEELLNVDISTVLRVPQATIDVPAAVHVITQDDIRRSGATSIPEVLRLAPGIQVARIDAGKYAIGMRGFADRLSRSMLVLIDGRAVYSPLFAGTYWEVQDTLLDDVDRIEVIRGPGGTLWGSNAVNGIINIVTKTANASTGTLVKAGGGADDRVLLIGRYGGTRGERLAYRAFAKAFDRASHFHEDDLDNDSLRMVRTGGRLDWTDTEGRTLMVQGDIYAGWLGQRSLLTTYTSPFTLASDVESRLSGWNVLGRWSASTGQSSSVQVQVFYDRTSRDERPVKEERDTFDLDFQHRLIPWRQHEVVWGAGYRASSGRITAVAPTAFVPSSRTEDVFSAFAQDHITLAADRVRVILGSKIERNDYTGVEVQPSARVAVTPAVGHTLLWSITRAVRTPSRVETDYTTTSLVSPEAPTFVRLLPNPAFTAEELIAHEVGYRVHPIASAYVTASGFYNQLDDVLSTELLTSFTESAPGPPRVVLPVTFANGLEGHSYGAEVTVDVRPVPWWRSTANYSYLRIELTKKPGSNDVSQERRNEGLSPRHQAQLSSSIDVPGGWSFDWTLRYVSELPAGPVPEYVTSNLRAGWQISPHLELAVVGRDLHHAHHLEWAGGGRNVEIQRSGYVQLTLRR